MPKQKSTEYVRAFRERQRANRPPKKPPKSSSERCREYRARKKALLNAVQDSALQIEALARPRPSRSSTERCRKKDLHDSTQMDGAEEDCALPTDASPQGLVKRIVDFLLEKETISIFTLNCQSLRKKEADLRDEVVRKSSILVLIETWMQKNSVLDVPNFDCVVSFKRPETSAGGVAIYRNSMNSSITISPHILINLNQTDTMTAVSTSSIGDICSARCRLENGQIILIVAIYISPNRIINDIIEFIHHVLLPYTLEGSALLKKDWGSLPMILSGDFNVNFAQSQAQPLIEFFNQKFSLKLTSDKNMSASRFGTTIDAVFSRALETITSQTVCFLF